MLEYRIDFYQNILTLLILIISYLIVLLIGVKKKQDIGKVTLLFLWHTLFSVIYFLFSLFNVSDATNYYKKSVTNAVSEFYPGTPFVSYVASFISQGLDANYLNTTLFFNLIGSIGLIFLYLSIKPYLKIFRWYWFLILFTPSMSFWSASLSKDSISFFAGCLFLYAVTTSKNIFLLVPIAFFSMFMVRPHIGALILASYVIYFIIRARVHILFKMITLPAIFTGLMLSITFVEQYIGLDESSVDSYSDYIAGRESSNSWGGSSIDISSMSYPMKMFTYIFRPLPIEAHNITSLITSIENVILLFLFLFILFKSKFNLKPFIRDKNLWLFTYFLLTCSILALTTANLGIATRQKWMFMPVIIYLLIYVFHEYKLKSVKTKN